MIKVICQQCGKEFKVIFSRKNKAKFCSYQCYWKDKKGKKTWITGKYHTKNTKQKMKEAKKRFFESGGIIWNKGIKRKYNDALEKWRNSGGIAWNKGLTQKTDKRVKRITEITNEIKNTTHYKNNIGQKAKERWSDPDFAKKNWKAFNRRPTKPEELLLKILNNLIPNEYKYVGNGEFILGGKCPDFININGQKKLIELYGDYWHKGQNPQNRIDYFKKYGFNTLVIWEHELKETDLENRILEFNKIC